MSTGVVWFRRDLRLADNPAWAAATRQHRQVVPLLVVEPRLLAAAGPHRRARFLAAAAALAADLADAGGQLHVHEGDAATIVPRVVSAFDAAAVHYNDDVSRWSIARDGRVAADLASSGTALDRHWGTLVHPPGSVLTRAGTLSKVFTPFHRAWHTRPLDPVAPPGDASITDDSGPAVLPRPDASVATEPGGEAAAAARLTRFLDIVDDYPTTRDLPAVEGTSGLSADLRLGTIAPAHVAEVVGTATEGRAAFVRQLAWRDWWAHTTLEHPDIDRHSIRPAYDAIVWDTGPEADQHFTAWCEGRTGFPIVDAGMRQLTATGWMHNRVRMIAASFLVKDLGIDWRRGERWFRRLLIDGDVAQNAGNWQWVAGTGPDAAPYFRIFNPVAQSRRFDPHGHYVRRWVPELAGLDDEALHAPWEAPPLELAAAGVVLGDTYPPPLVDHAEAREITMARYRDAVS